MNNQPRLINPDTNKTVLRLKAPASSGVNILTLSTAPKRPMVSRDRVLRVDVSEWDVVNPDNDRAVLALLVPERINGHSTIRMDSMPYVRVETTSIRSVTPLYVTEHDQQVHEAQPVLTSDHIDVNTILKALQFFLATRLSSMRFNTCAAGDDPLYSIRNWPSEAVIELAKFVATKQLAMDYGIAEAVIAYKMYGEDLANGSIQSSVGIAYWPGANNHTVITMSHDSRGTTMYAVDVESGFVRVDIIPRGDSRDVNNPKRFLGRKFLSGDALLITGRLAPMVNTDVIDELNKRNGFFDTFKEIRELPPGSLEKLIDFVGLDERITSTQMYDALIVQHDASSIPVLYSPHWIPEALLEDGKTHGGGWSSSWATTLLNSISWVGEGAVQRTLRGERESVGIIDISELQQITIPENSFVREIIMQPSGLVRIILNEPVYPTMITRHGITYVEEETGTVLTDMSVAAIDLDMRGNERGFPTATAYSDEECTQKARHTNINTDGKVCLGDINSVELSVDGLKLGPCLADFIQMLRQCNLDSAYNSGRAFVFQKPDKAITEGSWERGSASTLEIKGMYKVNTSLAAAMEELARQTKAAQDALSLEGVEAVAAQDETVVDQNAGNQLVNDNDDNDDTSGDGYDDGYDEPEDEAANDASQDRLGE